MIMPPQKIQELHYNWFSTPEGEEYSSYTVGKEGVTHILHDSVRKCYSVIFGDVGEVTIFNPNRVVWVES
jgi:hypothetical protein